MTARLPTRSVTKPWGREALPAPFGPSDGGKIGEIWFEPPPALPGLLVKYIFTSENLSVQVHPSDEQTLARGLGRQGKEECWLIVDAEPGARLGIGFKKPLDGASMRAAALDGSIEDLMEWYPVRSGDFFYIPANTVHAIGAGISLIEIQQNSDITYRLYDYGRPRALHLEEGIAVAKGAPYPETCRLHLDETGSRTLVDGPLFRLDLVDGALPADVRRRYATGPLLVIPRTPGASIGGEALAPGECGLALQLDALSLEPRARVLIAQPLA